MSPAIRRHWRPGFEHLLEIREKDMASEPELALYRVGVAYQAIVRNTSESIAEHYPTEWDELLQAVTDALDGYRRHLHNRQESDQLSWLVAERDSVLEELDYIDTCAEIVVESYPISEIQALLERARAQARMFRRVLSKITPTMLLLEDHFQELENTMINNGNVSRLLELRNAYFAEPTMVKLEAYVGLVHSDPVLSGEAAQEWSSPGLNETVIVAEKLHQAVRLNLVGKLEVALLMHELTEDVER